MKREQLTPARPIEPSPTDAEPDFDLSSIIGVVLRRRFLLLQCVAVALVLAALFLAFSKRRYRARAELQLLSESSAVNLSNSNTPGDDGTLALTVTMETYVGVLTSDNLALQVVRQLDLEHAPEFRIKTGSSQEAQREETLPLEQTRFRREKMLSLFKNNLAVSSVSGSRLIDVSFLSTNPDLARRILNQLLTDFVGYNNTVRSTAARDTESLLGKQLADLRQNVETTQQHAAELQRQSGIYGAEGSQNLTLSRLDALNQELTNAEQNRIVKGAILHAVESSSPEVISNLSGNAGQASMPGSVNSLALLQNLRQQEANLSAQLAEYRGKYGASYPRVVQTSNQLMAVHQDIARETRRLSQRARNDYKAAAEQEGILRRQLEEQKQTATHVSDLSSNYLIANREAKSSRDLYEHLLEKMKETSIMAGLHDTSVAVLDPAHVGASATSPNFLLVLGGALGGGLLLGLCAVFLRESLDRTVRRPEALAKLTCSPVLGIVPLAGTRTMRTSESKILSPGDLTGVPGQTEYAESFRLLRTRVLRLLEGGDVKVLMVTSASHGEGKSSVVSNLAEAIGESGMRILVVDADLQTRGLTGALGLTEQSGLMHLLAEEEAPGTLSMFLRKQPKFDFLAAGFSRTSPSASIPLAKLPAWFATLRQQYDVILIDTAALLSSADTAALAQRVDATILVCRAAVTLKPTCELAFRLLRESGTPVLGAVLNAVDVKAPDYTYVYGVPDPDRHRAASVAGDGHGRFGETA